MPLGGSTGGSTTTLTHYDILGVKPDCTQEQIKSAFLTLSKKYHPDINSSDTKLHNKFVKINEAYSVLRAAESRRAYDLKLNYRRHFSAESIRRASPYQGYPYYQASRQAGEEYWWARQRHYYDPSIDPHRTRGRKHYSEDTYYGIKGIRRQPNSTIMFACMVFVVIGSFAQFLAITHSHTFRRSLLQQQSDARALVYGQTRKKAQENGNEKQLELLAQTLGDSNEVD